MRKLTPIFLVLASAIMLLGGCGMSASERAEQQRLDSIFSADSLRAARHLRDSLRLADSLANVDFVTPDLRTFGLKGHVKQVIETTDNSYTTQLLFDEKGVLVSHSAYDTDKSKVVRDGNDRIISLINLDSWEGGNDGMDFKYTSEGIPSAISHWESGHDSYVFSRYDSHGWPIEGAISDSEDQFTGKVSYSYTKTDNHGNWTTQIAIETWPEVEDTRHTIVRKITYYR